METAVNALLDNIASVLWRIAQFPIVFQIFIWLVLLACLLFTISLSIRVLVKRPLNAQTLITAWSTITIVSIAIIISIILDTKEKIQREESELREHIVIPIKHEIPSDSIMNWDSIPTIGKIAWQLIYDTKGIRVRQGTCADGPLFMTIAEVDLRKVRIRMDTACSEKERTSKFAKEFNCAIAINGEAGTRPGMDAPLGQWIGNYIIEGFPVYFEDTEHRPFLAFGKRNHDHYSPEKEKINKVDSSLYNTMWGRFDLLGKGSSAISDYDGTKNTLYPRTLMGIDSTGYNLILAIVDGRQPQHSVGMTMEQCAQLMLAFGTHDGMACDQGGSSYMFVKGIGIVNLPSDGGERAVYTHFGLEIID